MRKFFIFILCFCTIFLCFAIPSFADEGVTSRAVPTDLTGVTVTVPAGWSVTAGYGLFDIHANFTNTNPDVLDFNYLLGLGYDYFNDFDWSDTSANIISVGASVAIRPSTSFTIEFLGGPDASNSSLIQWFVDNNATFDGGSPPTPETSSIAGGTYHFKTFGNLPDVPDPPWSNPEGYTYGYNVHGKLITTSRTIPFTFIDITFDEYVSNSHYTLTFSFTTDDGVIDIATYSVSYGQIQLEIRPDFKYFVFDEDFIDEYNDIEFIRQFLVSGFPDTDTSATDNPWAYILEMIIDALKVDLFGYFSVWDIFTTICGIFIVTWLLKLLAGG